MSAWKSVIISGICILTLSCSKNQEKILYNFQTEKILNKWIEAEMLNQKYTAERKYSDSLKCIRGNDSLSVSQRDSVIRYWSVHPDELRKITARLTEQK